VATDLKKGGGFKLSPQILSEFKSEKYDNWSTFAEVIAKSGLLFF